LASHVYLAAAADPAATTDWWSSPQFWAAVVAAAAALAAAGLAAWTASRQRSHAEALSRLEQRVAEQQREKEYRRRQLN
jgi:anti-sigma-K factor RskA